MNIIIIGDKYQKGMKSKGCAALIKYNQYLNILQNQFDTIKKISKNSSIIYIAGFESKKIENFLFDSPNIDLNLILNSEYEKYNDIYSLSLAKEFLIDNTLILFGYNILHTTMFKNLETCNDSMIFLDDSSESGIGCIVSDGRITNITYDLPNSINHIYYISKKDINLFREYVCDNKYKNYFLFEIINKLIDSNVCIRPHSINTKKKTIKKYGYNKAK